TTSEGRALLRDQAVQGDRREALEGAEGLLVLWPVREDHEGSSVSNRPQQKRDELLGHLVEPVQVFEHEDEWIRLRVREDERTERFEHADLADGGVQHAHSG